MISQTEEERQKQKDFARTAHYSVYAICEHNGRKISIGKNLFEKNAHTVCNIIAKEKKYIFVYIADENSGNIIFAQINKDIVRDDGKVVL